MGEGAELISIGALLAEPGRNPWVFLMLFSTIVPTGLHLLLALPGVMWFFPFLPRRILSLINRAPGEPVLAVAASLLMTLSVMIPAMAVVGIVWLLWLWGGPAIEGFLDAYLDWYLDAMLWLSISINAL